MTAKTTPLDIRQFFNTIAVRYDLTNHCISFGMNTYWYRTFVKQILKASPPHKVLDICCGTGAVPEMLVRAMREKNLPLPTIDCVDFSEKMLDYAKERLIKKNISPRFINCDASDLPLVDGSYDTITLSYGIRNLTEKKKALLEAFRLLQPHGSLYILELTTPHSSLIRCAHTVYMKTIVPLLGLLLTRHTEPYFYLDYSIEHFSLPDLLHTLHEVGFSCHKPLSLSFGMATIVQAEKI